MLAPVPPFGTVRAEPKLSPPETFRPLAKVEDADAKRFVNVEKFVEVNPFDVKPPTNVEVADEVAIILENSLYPLEVKFLVARDPRKVEVAIVEVALRERKLGVIESTSLNW